jgi:hypothetical protein
MRAKEFINEAGNARRSKIRGDALNAIPSMHYHPQTDFYHMYRMGVAVASMPKGPHADHSPFGPTENYPVSLGYTDEEKEMTKLASKYVGITHSEITSPDSKEESDVNNTSPVSKWNKKRTK